MKHLFTFHCKMIVVLLSVLIGINIHAQEASPSDVGKTILEKDGDLLLLLLLPPKN